MLLKLVIMLVKMAQKESAELTAVFRYNAECRQSLSLLTSVNQTVEHPTFLNRITLHQSTYSTTHSADGRYNLQYSCMLGHRMPLITFTEPSRRTRKHNKNPAPKPATLTINELNKKVT